MRIEVEISMAWLTRAAAEFVPLRAGFKSEVIIRKMRGVLRASILDVLTAISTAAPR